MSWKRYAVVAVLGLSLWPVGQAQAQTTLAVKPGEAGTLTLPFKNEPDGLGDLENVSVNVVAPPQFIIKSASVLGPTTVPLGQVVNFVVSYEIAADAAEGSFDVTLNLDIPEQIVEPDADTLSSVVSFPIGEVSFLVGAQLRAVFKSEPFGGLKLSGERLPYRQAGRQALRAGIKDGVARPSFDLKAQSLETGLRAAFSVEESLAARKAHNLEVSGRFLRRAATNLVAFPSSGALPRAWLPRKDSNPQPTSYLKVSASGVPGETRTRDLLGHTPDGMKPDLSNKSAKEIARWLVGWLRREKMSSPYVINEFEEVVERLPDVRSLSLACAKGTLYEDRGVRRGQARKGPNNG